MHAKPYRKGAHYCDLCLTEKVVIALADGSYLNKRSEINSKCRHANEFKLSYIQLNPPLNRPSLSTSKLWDKVLKSYYYLLFFNAPTALIDPSLRGACRNFF